MQLKAVFDSITFDLNLTYEALNEISSDFDFLTGDPFAKMNTDIPLPPPKKKQ